MAVTNHSDLDAAALRASLQDDPLVGYLVVRHDADPADAVAACATATLKLLGCDLFAASADAQRWAQRSMRKVTLTAKPAKFETVRDTLPGVCADDIAVALLPMRKSERPRVLGQLQARSRPLPELPGSPAVGSAALQVVLCADLEMTVGKACAQASHAAMLALAHGAASSDTTVQVASVDRGLFDALCCEPDVFVVRDAGVTEVEAGSRTAVALPAGWTASR
jgi:peptidyl-tRNA hydrolase